MNVIMIMCHKNIDQVIGLIKRCVSDKTKVILHLDKEYYIEDEKRREIEQIENLYLVNKRIHGQLDTRSLVDIVMHMVNKALDIEKKEQIHFKYYLLLSGQDYLTKPIEFVNDELERSYPAPFIDCTPYDRKNWVYHKFKYTRGILAYNRWLDRTFRNRKSLVRKALKVVGICGQRIVCAVRMSDAHMLAKKNISLYGGSAWWILPDIIIEYIANEYNDNSELVKKLLGTYTPEETFFQVMAMRSPFRELVKINPKDMREQNCKTWAYFSDEDKSFVGHPYILTSEKFEKIVNKDCWIARKFDITVDKKIILMLDEYINHFDMRKE